MSVRLIFIGLMVFLGFWYIAILLWLMNRLNKSSEERKVLKAVAAK